MFKQLLFGVFSAVGFALVSSATTEARAADWMFEPSYFSHADSPGYSGIAPQPRGAYRAPFVGAHPKFAIRGGIRYNNYQLYNGNSLDRTLYRESWFDANY